MSSHAQAVQSALNAHNGRNSGTLKKRVRAGSNMLNELGGSTDVTREANTFVIRGHGCPLSEAVVACPETCRAVEQMLAEVIGTSVVESPPNCQFRVSTPG